MMLIVVLAVTLAIFGSSIADEEMETRLLKFYKCLACTKDPAPLEEFMECAKKQPAQAMKTVENCKLQVMPDAKTLEEQSEVYCKNEGGVAEKLDDCIADPEKRKNFSDEDKRMMKEFKECALEVNKKYFSDH